MCRQASGTKLKGVDFTSSGTALGGVTERAGNVSACTVFYRKPINREYAFRNAEKCGQLTGIIMVGS